MMKNHAYDHTCCCMDCVEEERRLNNQLASARENNSPELQRFRATQDYELRLQVIKIGK